MSHDRHTGPLPQALLALGLLLAGGGCGRPVPPPPPAPLDLSDAPPPTGPCGSDEAAQVRMEPQRAPRHDGPQLGLAAVQLAPVVAAHSGAWNRPELLLEMQLARRAAAKPAATTAPAMASRPWEIQFAKGNTMEMYARQLEFFGFELGVILPDNRITYIPHPAKPKTDLRTAPADLETRAYLSWSRGDLIEADRNVARQAGIEEAEERLILCFLPPKLEATLAELEKKHAGAKFAQVTKTRFGVRPKGEEYELYVIEQSYQARPGGGR